MILQEAASLHYNDIEVIDKKYGFTRREKEIFKLVVKGLGAVETSKELGISKETAKVHIHNIFRKMGIARRSEILSML